MKQYTWIVEILNPINLDTILWRYCGETLEKVCIEWSSQSNNNFLNYHKLHNIFHCRNKSDNQLIKVRKVKKHILEIEDTD